MKEKLFEILERHTHLDEGIDYSAYKDVVNDIYNLRYLIAEEVWMEWQKDLKTPHSEYWLWMRNKKRCQQEEQCQS